MMIETNSGAPEREKRPCELHCQAPPRSSRWRGRGSAFLVAALVPLVANAQPAAPAGLLATPGNFHAILTWSDPSNSAITRYEIRFGAGEAPDLDAWTEVTGSGADTVEHRVFGLTGGTRYAFELRAVDEDGASEAATASTTLAASPGDYVAVPDEQLRRLIEQHLGYGVEITEGNLAKLRALRDTQRRWIADLAGLEFALNLVTLALAGNDIPDVSPLAGLTSLRDLDMSDNKLTDISPLASVTSLQGLDLSSNGITDVSALAGLTSLTRLDLAYNELSDVSPLSGLASLSYLALSHNELSDISPLSELASLTQLRLWNNDLTDVSPLSGLASLSHLNLASNELSDISPLSELTSLTQLWLPENELTDVSPLSGLTSLRELSLSANRLTDISPLSSLPSLQDLYLSANVMADISPLSGLTSLRVLHLSGNQLADIPPLSGLTSLYSLDLSANQLSDVAGLSGMSRLGALFLSGNEISDVSPLSGLTRLWELYLSDNEISDVSPLSGLTSLRNLVLSGNEIADVSPLSALTSLTRLDLSGNELADVSLSGLSSLTKLDLSGNNKLVDLTLSGLSSLTTLDLSGNTMSSVSLSGLTSLPELDLSDQGISDLALSGLTSLYSLNLRGNELADVSALSSLVSLWSLNLSANKVSDVSPLSRLTSLGYLYLSNNRITDVSPLSGLPSVRSLSLANNELSDISSLSSVTSLRSLYLAANAIADISPLPHRLEDLYLANNELSDISPLSELTSLASLDLAGNAIADVSSLSRLTSLTWLRLRHNAIADLSALSRLASLRWVWLEGNAISDIASLGGWEQLSYLDLRRNAVADISPLRQSGLAAPGNFVDLRGNPLRDGHAEHVAALRESGTAVEFDDGGHRVPLFPSSSAGSSLVGFVRVINHSDEPGNVRIEAVDETGDRRGPASLAINAGQALHFNAGDLEQGNPAKGLLGVGEASGDWRLVLRSELDIEVLGYTRTPDGFVTSLHDLTPERTLGGSVAPTFNPGSNRRQRSRLRLINPTAWPREAEIVARDDAGVSRSFLRPTVIRTPAFGTRDFTAAQLESGLDMGGDGVDLQSGDFVGIGDGTGKWRLNVDAIGQRVMSLLQSPTGHLTNISTGTAVSPQNPAYYAWVRGGRYRVPLFLAAPGDTQGFLRVVNRSAGFATIALRVFDETGVEREPAALTLKASEVLHFNSDHLEAGNAAKGLPGIGAGSGDWHLEVSADRRFEVLAYARTADGFVTSLHDIAPRAEDGSLWIPFFNPGSNPNQISRLRLVNWGETAAEATIVGIDDAGSSPGEAVRVTVPARAARDYTALELEMGSAFGLSGALGDGSGKWRLRVSSTGDIEAMSLLELPTGHITNLSTTPRYRRPAPGGLASGAARRL